MQSLMQKTAAQRASVARTSSRPARASRVAVRAIAEQSRREVFGGLLAGVASLVLAESAQAAASSVDLFDDRKVKATGYDAIYEARQAELPQAVREGFSQARSDLATTKARVKESEKRIDTTLIGSIQKAYWTEAREELRRQVGTLRFDINALAETKPKADKKAALDLKKQFLAKVESLDFAIRQKNKDSALAALSATQSSLDAVLTAVL